MCRRPEQRGATRPGARALARRLHHENPRKSGRFGRHHRVRSDRRSSFDGRNFEALLDIGPDISRAPPWATKVTPARPTAPPRQLAASLPSFLTRPTRRTSRPSSQDPLQGPRSYRTGLRAAQALQTRRSPMRKDSTEFQIDRQLRCRPMLDQIRPHGLVNVSIFTRPCGRIEMVRLFGIPELNSA